MSKLLTLGDGKGNGVATGTKEAGAEEIDETVVTLNGSKEVGVWTCKVDGT